MLSSPPPRPLKKLLLKGAEGRISPLPIYDQVTPVMVFHIEIYST